MQIENVSKEECLILLNKRELGIINNALNEIGNGLHENEFQTRSWTASDRAEVRDLLSQVSQAIKTVR